MAKATLFIPEENLREVIVVIMAGLSQAGLVSEEIKERLTEWCAEQTEYLERR